MTPQQKRAIIVMIDSIQHQLDAVRALLAEPGEAAAMAGGGTSTPTGGPIPDYLTPKEEDELGTLFNLTPADKSALLGEFMKRTAPQAEGKPDVVASSQG